MRILISYFNSVNPMEENFHGSYEAYNIKSGLNYKNYDFGLNIVHFVIHCILAKKAFGHPLIKYATEERRNHHHPKCVQLRTEGGGITLHVNIPTYLLPCFWQRVYLVLSCIICRNLILRILK